MQNKLSCPELTQKDISCSAARNQKTRRGTGECGIERSKCKRCILVCVTAGIQNIAYL